MSTDFTIRIASPEDEKSVTALLEASYPILMSSRYSQEILSVVLPTMTKANPSLLSSGTFYLAEIANKLVIGCGGWTKERPGNGEIIPGVGHIRHFATHPEWVGKSVGRTIYQRCEREAKIAKIHCLECYSSLNAESFYTALGFKALKNIDIFLSNNQKITSIWMRRFI
jgi:GNAT superfamily N-acetyltransferase